MLSIPFRKFALLARDHRVRLAWRAVLWLFWIGYFGFALIFLALRYAVLPHIDAYRGDIERALSEALGRPVAIADVDADWQGLRPRLSLHGFEVRDGSGREMLTLNNVEAVLSWTSLYHFELRLRRLEIVAPSLLVHRDASGKLFVAGLEVDPTRKGSGFSDWLLAQGQIVVRDAAITWVDELRQAPPLTFGHLNFLLENSFSRHRFALTAEPPRDMAARLDLRGEFHGNDLGNPAAWRGEAYTELDYADLAVWRRWFDYPLDLPQGRGGLRLWLGVADGGVANATADIALADVRLRLARDLPEVDIERLNGRLTGKRSGDEFTVSAKALALATRDGLRVEPTDFSLHFAAAASGRPSHGEFTANGLDIDAVARLAAYLPLSSERRAELAAYAPRGRLTDLKLDWEGVAGSAGWNIQSRFENLGLAAQGRIPGFAGVAGRLEGSDKGGSFELTSRAAALDLPGVFADPRLPLSRLDAAGSWKSAGEGIEIEVGRASFANADTEGEAHGRYVGRPGKLGEIDLTGKLSNARAAAVWRYMPLVAGAGVRNWLQQALTGGIAEEATLRLKGDLARFPFADGSGIFQVKGRFHDGVLRYAEGWPEMVGVAGRLLFEGRRMVIDGEKAQLFGVAIGATRAEIRELDAAEPLLTVNGKAAGATGDFLRFVEGSPVGEHIDHFTEDMHAEGNGQLELKLSMPLKHVDRTRVEGNFAFANNRIVVLPDLPALTEASGRLAFTGDSLTLPRARANYLGAPMTLEVKTGAGGVQVVAEGRLDIAALRRQYDLPLFEHLSGSAPLRANIAVRKRVPEVHLESTLVGIASSLPAPFNKSALDSLPLRVDRKPGTEPGRESITASLGRDVSATVLRRRQGGSMAIERGVVAIGEAMTMPERGLLLSARVNRFDLDVWRRMALAGNGQAPSLPLTVRLKAAEANAFGYRFNDLAVNAVQAGDGWGAQVSSRELSGSLNWRSQGAGRLVARLRQLTVVSGAASGAAASGAGSEELDQLPGLDVEAEQFNLHGMELGRLKLSADNHDGQWDAKFDIDNGDGNLNGTGSWKRSGAADTRLQFKLTAASIGKLLARFGYPDAVRRGTASLEGNVSWNGAPTAIDYPSLSGKLKLEAQNGQFNKLEPGVGRLLGILSLQTLPRRITLDFRDIFSDGFAFDGIEGDATIAQGVVDTQNLSMSGPAAKTLTSGKVNLANETLDLRVRVLPALGESLAVGAMFVHPVGGAVAWLVQKIFKDPVGQAFAYEYGVSGPWGEPKVEKLAAPTNAGAAAKSNSE